MEELTSFFLGLLVMVIDIVLWVSYANTEGVLRIVLLILASVLIGAFFNRRLI